MLMKKQPLFEADPYLHECESEIVMVSDYGILLEESVFFPVGGGQLGDTGYLFHPDKKDLRIINSVRDSESGSVWHIPDDPLHSYRIGDCVTACIDWERRLRLMRMHSCIHLLSSVVQAPITGCSIGSDRGRLDFDLPENALCKEEITESINGLIEQGLAVNDVHMSVDELVSKPELVRTRNVRPPDQSGPVRLIEIEGVDLQPCGGTHVANTREIGRVKCSKIEKKSRFNRRFTLTWDE